MFLTSNAMETYFERLEEEINYYKNVLEEINCDIGFSKSLLLSLCHWIDNYSYRRDRKRCYFLHCEY